MVYVRSIDNDVAAIVTYSKRGEKITGSESTVPTAELKKQ